MIFLIQIKPVKPRASAAPHRQWDKRERQLQREREGGGGRSVVSLSFYQIADERCGVGESFKQDPRVWGFLKPLGNQASDKTLKAVWNICIRLENL